MGGSENALRLAPVDDVAQLRQRVLDSLRDQGFKLHGQDALIAPVNDKDSLRQLHAQAVAIQREQARGALESADVNFTKRLVPGSELNPANVTPALRVLDPGRSNDAKLWRWCSLHWSIPVSGGYGRRVRALIVDEGHNDAIMGVVGLGDPVYSLGVRDRAIGWTPEQRQLKLTSVMDAFVLGATPPYSALLGGKLAALMLTSDEIRSTFGDRYGHRQTRIAGRDPGAELALITTASALGRSSVYNRVRAENGTLALHPVGYTQGTGDFHFSGEVYDILSEAARAAMRDSGTVATHRHDNWGTGFRNRREVVQRGLRAVGLSPSKLRVHGVQREVFMAPLAANSLKWLRGSDEPLDWMTRPSEDIGLWWKQNWMLRRSETTSTWRDFDPTSWRLYP